MAFPEHPDLEAGTTDPGPDATVRPSATVGAARPEASRVFDLLRVAVDESYSAGRAALGASLKPRLQELLQAEGVSDRPEDLVGVGSFRELLAVAQQSGHISVQRGDFDWEAFPVSTSPPPLRPPRSGTFPVDVWRAFTNWNPSTSWHYDRADGKVRSPEDGVATGDTQIPIEPVTAAEQREWLVEFLNAHAQTIPAAPRLLETAQAEDPVDGIVGVQEDPEFQPFRKEWGQTRAPRVIQRMRDWASQHALTLTDLQRAGKSDYLTPAGNRQAPSRRQESTVLVADVIRAHVHDAIDRMPLSDLLRLPIPVEFLLRD